MKDFIKNAGGPAFPTSIFVEGTTRSSHVGMTLREYFAVHAPTDIPNWFTAELTPLPLRPKNAAWCKGCDDGFDCENTPKCLSMKKWSTEYYGILELRKCEHYFQWRKYYADMMIKTLTTG
jgi:hypothetical protein